MSEQEFKIFDQLFHIRFMEFGFFILLIFFNISIILKFLGHKFLINFYFRKVFKFFLKLEEKEKLEINQIFLLGYEKAKEIISKNKLKIKILTIIISLIVLSEITFFILYKIYIYHPKIFLFIHPESFVLLTFQTIFLPLFIYFWLSVRKKLLIKFEEKIKNFNFVVGDNYFFDEDYENFELTETKIPRKSGNLHSKNDYYPLSFIILRKYFYLWKLKTDELINLYYFLIWGSHLQESDTATTSYQFLYKDFVTVLKNEKGR